MSCFLNDTLFFMKKPLDFKEKILMDYQYYNNLN